MNHFKSERGIAALNSTKFFDKEILLTAIKSEAVQTTLAPEKANGTKLDYIDIVEKHKAYRAIKRIQDIILSFFALLLLFAPLMIVALAIFIDSPGASPIFVQKRVGRLGKEFKLLKFRTMKPNAEDELSELLSSNEMSGPVFKMKNDPRVTRLGRLLRKFSIDEFPQLVNVLLGHMSIVGPRPALPREVAQYDSYENQRLYVTPGLSCYWQTQPNRNSLSFEEWLELDLKYIKERSFTVDWKIIFKTFGAVLGRHGV